MENEMTHEPSKIVDYRLRYEVLNPFFEEKYLDLNWQLCLYLGLKLIVRAWSTSTLVDSSAKDVSYITNYFSTMFPTIHRRSWYVYNRAISETHQSTHINIKSHFIHKYATLIPCLQSDKSD